MELSVFYMPFLSIFFILFSMFYMPFLSIFFILFSLSLSILSRKNSKINLPHGNMGFPFIGETFTYLSKARNGEAENFISERMSKFSPQAFKTSLFGEPMITFCGALGNKFLFSNENKLVQVWFPSSVNKIFPYSDKTSPSEEMIKLRKFLPKFLSAEALQRYIGIMDSTAQTQLNSNWEDKDEVTVFPLTKLYTFTLACRLFVSIEDPKHIAKFFKSFDSFSSGMFSIPINLPGTAFSRAIKASKLVRKEIHEMIKQRKVDLLENKVSPTQDILSHMLSTPLDDGNFMEEMDMVDKVLGLLVGGHDSTSNTIACIIKYLAELPQVYNIVLKEQKEIAKSKAPGDLLDWNDIRKMKYSWNVVCEVMRLTPPVQGTFREAIADFSYAGFTIPKGWKLYWNPYTSHKDPKYFPEPKKFDPSRFEGSGPAPYTYVPFGGGPRMCPGKEYARLAILVFIHNLVKRFEWEVVIPNERIISNPLSMPEHGLPIRLFPTTN